MESLKELIAFVIGLVLIVGIIAGCLTFSKYTVTIEGFKNGYVQAQNIGETGYHWVKVDK